MPQTNLYCRFPQTNLYCRFPQTNLYCRFPQTNLYCRFPQTNLYDCYGSLLFQIGWSMKMFSGWKPLTHLNQNFTKIIYGYSSIPCFNVKSNRAPYWKFQIDLNLRKRSLTNMLRGISINYFCEILVQMCEWFPTRKHFHTSTNLKQ
jgi:hypothetical protein